MNTQEDDQISCLCCICHLVSMPETKSLAKPPRTCDRSSRNYRTLSYPHLRFLAVGCSISFLYSHSLDTSAESQHPFGRHPQSTSVLQKALSEGRRGKLWALIWW